MTILAKNHSFDQKMAVSIKNSTLIENDSSGRNHNFAQKMAVLIKKSQIWPNAGDFDQKITVLIENDSLIHKMTIHEMRESHSLVHGRTLAVHNCLISGTARANSPCPLTR